MKRVRLSNAEIKNAIELGDSAYGSRYLVVDPDGEYRIVWCEQNRPWDPWREDDNVIGLPSLFPEGDGEESDDAKELFRAIGRYDEISAICEERDISFPEAAEEFIPDEWKDGKAAKLDWLADAFLAACNGDGGELNMIAPWGYVEDGGYDEIAPPFEFEWE